jgi:DNA polymerase III alpha subunit
VKINNYGEVELTDKEAFEALYTGKIKNLEGVYVDSIGSYNHARDINADRIPQLTPIKHDKFDSVEMFDEANQLTWFMPEEYESFPIVDWLFDQCKNDEQRNRVELELKLFIQHDMLHVLFYCKYLVDTMRANNILWGVGRGSSVASYILYLIGIHKIDSIKYELSIDEFIK